MSTKLHAIFDLPKTQLRVLARAQRKLLSEREARGFTRDERSVKNLCRIEAELQRSN